MLAFILFHSQDTRESHWFKDEGIDKLKSIKYDLVGRIETDSLDNVYSLTQNWDGSWTNNPEVTYLGRKPDHQRSSVIGDLVAEVEDGFLRALWVINSVGFVQVKDPKFRAKLGLQP